MYQKFKQYFEISKREFRGMMVFIIILFIVYVSPYVYEKLTYQPLKVTVQTLQPKIVEIESFKQKSTYKDYKGNKSNEVKEGTLFNFNPNNLSLEDWMKLGLSEKQAKSIKNYESKGGKFRTKADVKKMYAISDFQFQRLEPYIQIPEENSSSFKEINKETQIPTKTVEKVKIDINDADSAMLTNIRGIGPSFASRIVKYRNRLGGFHSKEQLKEVFGIDSLKYSQIENQIKIEVINLKQIKINECVFEDLKNFPYLSYKQMNAMVAYRKQHGPYKSIDDLNKIAILTPEIIQKIKPYLSF
ncbi:helix-hairpin-helix domain-containing protein [Pelobium sp.]|nr:helix-hairpin-helix domain-containing protein [Pelobium sp.]MDA9555278.1 helix-hairpin-helix domain-containing protein [Pelobium sp.]